MALLRQLNPLEQSLGDAQLQEESVKPGQHDGDRANPQHLSGSLHLPSSLRVSVILTSHGAPGHGAPGKGGFKHLQSHKGSQFLERATFPKDLGTKMGAELFSWV